MANTIKLKQLDQIQLAAFVNELIDGTGLVYTASRAVVTDSSGDITTSPVTSTELGYVSGVTSAIQTQLNAKLSSTLTSAYVFVGNVSNVATAVAITGDITITNVGVSAIGSNKVTLGQMATMATASLLGRNTAGTGNVEVLNAATALTLIGALPLAGGAMTGPITSSGSDATALTVLSGYNTNNSTAGAWVDIYHINTTQKKTVRFGGRRSPAYGGNFGEFVVQVSSANAFGTDSFVLDYSGRGTLPGGLAITGGNSLSIAGASGAFGLINGTPSTLNTAFYVTDTLGIKVKASAVDGFIFHWQNRFGINTISPSGGLHVVSQAAGTVGGIFQGAASQSANLTEWQNSSATVLANISSDGYLSIGNGNTAAGEKIHLKSGDPAIKLENAGGDSWLLQVLESSGIFRIRSGSDWLSITTAGAATFGGTVKSTGGYISSDGSTGATGSATSANTLTIKNGLVTNIA